MNNANQPPVLILPSSSILLSPCDSTNEFIASVNGWKGVVSISLVVLYVSPVTLLSTELELSTELLLLPPPNNDPIAVLIPPNSPVDVVNFFLSTVV